LLRVIAVSGSTSEDQKKIWVESGKLSECLQNGFSRVGYLILEDEGEIMKYAPINILNYDYISAHKLL